jgi:predicted nucleic acid-binding protein
VLTIDASVWVAADAADEEAHDDCAAFLRGAVAAGTVVNQPTLSLVEVTAALARRTRDHAFAERAGLAILGTPGVQVHPLDRELAIAASAIASRAFLRGADAVYAATAVATGSTLITLDGELLTRGIPGLEILTPSAWLAAQHVRDAAS